MCLNMYSCVCQAGCRLLISAISDSPQLMIFMMVHCMGGLILNNEVVNEITDKLLVNSHELAIHSYEF